MDAAAAISRPSMRSSGRPRCRVPAMRLHDTNKAAALPKVTYIAKSLTVAIL